MSRYNLNDYSVAKVDETGGTYYYYLYLKPKDHAGSDNTGWYILRTNVSGTEFKYVFGINDSDTAWTNKASYTFRDLNTW